MIRINRVYLLVATFLFVGLRVSAEELTVRKLYIHWSSSQDIMRPLKQQPTAEDILSGQDDSYQNCAAGYNNVNGNEGQQGLLTAENASGQILFRFPVRMEIQSGGVSIGCQRFRNLRSTILNWNRKPLESIFGVYMGSKLGATAGPMQAGRLMLGINSSAIILVDATSTQGFMFDLSGTRMEIKPAVLNGMSEKEIQVMIQFMKSTRLVE